MYRFMYLTAPMAVLFVAFGSVQALAQQAASIVLPPQAGRGMPAFQSTHPDFSGHWTLDVAASDDPQERLKAAARSMRQDSGGGRGMGGGSGRPGGRGGKGGGQGSQGGPGGMGARGGMTSADMAALASKPERLDITHDEPLLVITDEHDQSQRLYTDFRGASVSASNPAPQRVAVAGWEGNDLVVEMHAGGGGRLIRSYHLDREAGRLMVSTTVDHPEMNAVTYRLVYDRKRPSTALTTP